MQLTDLDYQYPPELIAIEPSRPTRVAFTAGPGAEPQELTIDQLLSRFGPNDLFVVNETKVVPTRVFTEKEDVEILFLRPVVGSETEWEVLFPARDYAIGDQLRLPGDIKASLVRKGRPQVLAVSKVLTNEYFGVHGEMALPPYIQQARAQRRSRASDHEWYQPAWARHPGSVAAPTASLHFNEEHLARLKNVARVTLHVGAGTFLPVRANDLSQHEMHSEPVEMPIDLPQQIRDTRAHGGRVWALGTTVARALESMDRLEKRGERLIGETSIFIYPPYEFNNVDVLLTNFHQPRSTLLALVAAFADLKTMKRTYEWAIDRRFRLFSYGDLSAWFAPRSQR